MNLSREERETVILGNAASREWEVCTADPRIIRKLERQGYKREGRENPWGYVSFRLPFNRLSIRKREGRKLTPGNLAKMASMSLKRGVIADSGKQNKK